MNQLKINDSPVVLIEWRDSKKVADICKIRTVTEEYRCGLQKDGTLLLQLDSDIDRINGDYWISPVHKGFVLFGDKANRIQEFDVDSLASIFDFSTVFVEELFWCGVCKDYTLEHHPYISECGHIRHIDNFGWGGCGYTEEDYSEEYEESFMQLSQGLLGKKEDFERFTYWLKQRDLGSIYLFLYDYFGYKPFNPAIKYLDSLDKNVPQEFFDQAINWIQPKR